MERARRLGDLAAGPPVRRLRSAPDGRGAAKLSETLTEPAGAAEVTGAFRTPGLSERVQVGSRKKDQQNQLVMLKPHTAPKGYRRPISRADTPRSYARSR